MMIWWGRRLGIYPEHTLEAARIRHLAGARQGAAQNSLAQVWFFRNLSNFLVPIP